MVDYQSNDDTRMAIDQEPRAVKSIEGWIILVTGLHEETSEEDIQDKFADYGTIKNLHLNLDRRSGYVKGYAFIEYAEKEEADGAIEDANGSSFLGKTIKVAYTFVEPPEETTNDERQDGERDRSRSPERRD